MDNIEQSQIDQPAVGLSPPRRRRRSKMEMEEARIAGLPASLLPVSTAFHSSPLSDMDVRVEKMRAEAREKAALLAAGLQPDQIDAAPKIQEWIWNEKIGSLSPRFPGFLPVEEGMFLYTPAAGMPVTDATRQLHIDLCKQRVNTTAISAFAKEVIFNDEQSGLIAPTPMMTAEQARAQLPFSIETNRVV